jgi:hypothetical protein
MTKKYTKDDDMVGFEDFIQHTQGDKVTRPKKKMNDGSFEFLTLLTDDQKRLDKISFLYQEKHVNLNKYSQDFSLQIKQEKFNHVLLRQIFQKINKPNSLFLKNMNRIFEQHFSSDQHSKE